MNLNIRLKPNMRNYIFFEMRTIDKCNEHSYAQYSPSRFTVLPVVNFERFQQNIPDINLYHTNGLSAPPENTRKPEVFCFQGVQRQPSGMKWINQALLIKMANMHFPVNNTAILKPLLVRIFSTISLQCSIFIPLWFFQVF